MRSVGAVAVLGWVVAFAVANTVLLVAGLSLFVAVSSLLLMSARLGDIERDVDEQSDRLTELENRLPPARTAD